MRALSYFSVIILLSQEQNTPFDVATSEVQKEWVAILKMAPFVCPCCDNKKDHNCVCNLHPFEDSLNAQVQMPQRNVEIQEVLAWKQVKVELSNAVIEGTTAIDPTENKENIVEVTKRRDAALQAAIVVTAKQLENVLSSVEKDRLLLACANKLREASNVHYEAARAVVDAKLSESQNIVDRYTTLKEELDATLDCIQQMLNNEVHERWQVIQDKADDHQAQVALYQSLIEKKEAAQQG